MSVRYLQLDSESPTLLSNSSSLGCGTRRSNTTGLNFANSNYAILENIKSGVGEWNSILGSNIANSLIVGYTTRRREPRRSSGNALPVRRHPRTRARCTPRSASSPSLRTTSSATTPSRSRTTSPGTAGTTRSRSAAPRRSTTPTTSSSPAPRASTSTTRSPTSTPTPTTTSPTRTATASPVTLRRLPGALQQHPGPGQAPAAARRLVRGPLRPGRVAGSATTSR